MKLLGNFIGNAAASSLFAMMVITFVDVTGRQVFNRPLDGATELTEITLMVTSFLLFPLIALKRLNIKVDLLEHFFSTLVMHAQRIITGVFGAAFFAALSYRLWALGSRSFAFGDITPDLAIPVGPIFWFMSLFSGATAIAFLAAIFVNIGPLASLDKNDEAGI